MHNPMASDRSYTRVFAGLAVGAALAAAYHLGAFGLACAHSHVDGAAWRHLAFVAIDAALCLLLLWRPRWLIVPVTLVAAQAFWSHGHGLWLQWHSRGQVDWISLLVLLYLPALLAAALWNAWQPRIKCIQK
jgi:hypothetical protein